MKIRITIPEDIAKVSTAKRSKKSTLLKIRYWLQGNQAKIASEIYKQITEG